MSNLYCVKCKTKTEDKVYDDDDKFNKHKNPHVVTSKNGRLMLKAECSICGTNKNQFKSKNKTDNTVDNPVVKSPKVKKVKTPKVKKEKINKIKPIALAEEVKIQSSV